jgi:hypothetical protein
MVLRPAKDEGNLVENIAIPHFDENAMVMVSWKKVEIDSGQKR